MTNNAINPNSYLKAFYSDIVLVKTAAVFGVKINDVNSIVGVFGWNDTTFETHTPIPLPAHTKKAVIRVMIKEGTIAPKHPAFVNVSGTVPFEYDNEDPYVLNYPPNPKGIALLEGSEIEVYGIDEIKKLFFFNNKNAGVALDANYYNPTPVDFMLNITLYK